MISGNEGQQIEKFRLHEEHDTPLDKMISRTKVSLMAMGNFVILVILIQIFTGIWLSSLFIMGLLVLCLIGWHLVWHTFARLKE